MVQRNRGENADNVELLRAEGWFRRPATSRLSSGGLRNDQRRSGMRQSIPSISIDSCADVSIIVAPGSAFDGHRKTLCSSRLVKRNKPVDQHGEAVEAFAHVDQVQTEMNLHALGKQRHQICSLAGDT